jgi:hypothetical protein
LVDTNPPASLDVVEPSAPVAAPAEAPAVVSAPPAAAGPVEKPLETVQELLRRKPAPGLPDMEALLARLEISQGAEEASFTLVRAMSRRDSKYHVRLGAFFDPLDTRPKGQLSPNAQYAYDEYALAGDLPEAKDRLKALTAWLATPAADGVDGVAVLRRQLGK